MLSFDVCMLALLSFETVLESYLRHFACSQSALPHSKRPAYLLYIHLVPLAFSIDYPILISDLITTKWDRNVDLNIGTPGISAASLANPTDTNM